MTAADVLIKEFTNEYTQKTFPVGSVVVCAHAKGIDFLTENKSYVVVNEPKYQEVGIEVINNNGDSAFYHYSRFLSLANARKRKIASVIDDI